VSDSLSSKATCLGGREANVQGVFLIAPHAFGIELLRRRKGCLASPCDIMKHLFVLLAKHKPGLAKSSGKIHVRVNRDKLVKHSLESKGTAIDTSVEGAEG
jgi:hypothetical protein